MRLAYQEMSFYSVNCETQSRHTLHEDRTISEIININDAKDAPLGIPVFIFQWSRSELNGRHPKLKNANGKGLHLSTSPIIHTSPLPVFKKEDSRRSTR